MNTLVRPYKTYEGTCKIPHSTNRMGRMRNGIFFKNFPNLKNESRSNYFPTFKHPTIMFSHFKSYKAQMVYQGLENRHQPPSVIKNKMEMKKLFGFSKVYAKTHLKSF